MAPKPSDQRRPDREQRILEIIETARAKRPRFKDDQVTMAHGAGGKATQTLIEGLLVPAFASEALAELARRRRRSPSTAPAVAMTTDTFVVKPLRFPGGSIGELAVNGTVNDLAVAGARPLAISVALVLEEGLDADVLRARGRGDRRGRRGGRRRGRRRRHEGRRARPRRRDVRLHDRASARVDPRASLAPASLEARRPGPRLGDDRRARHGDHARPRRARARRRHRVRHPLAVAGRRRAARRRRDGAALHARRDPRRGRDACSTSSRGPRASAIIVREADVPVTPEVAGRRRAARDRPDVRRQRGRDGRLRRARAPPTPRSPRCARCPAARRAAEIGEVDAEPPGMVLVETAFGGRRVMDLLAGDPLPRIC